MDLTKINIGAWIIIIICIFFVMFVLSTVPTVSNVERFSDQSGRFCITCAGKTFNQCLSCFNCGYCVDKFGNGQCIGGDHTGPYNKERCSKLIRKDNKSCDKFNEKLLEPNEEGISDKIYPQPQAIKDSMQYNNGDKYPLLNNPKDYLYYNFKTKSPNPTLRAPKDFLWYHTDPYNYMMQRNSQYGCKQQTSRNYITNI